MKQHLSGVVRRIALGAAIAFGLTATGFAQTESDLNPDAPDRYVVQEGDTLWGLAERFLRDPWRWPLIWRNNQQIENPHLIYPGDLLVVTSDYSVKVVRLEPKIRREPLERAIPTIPPNVIQPFLTLPLVVGEGELESAGHVVFGVEEELIMGKHQRFYARNLSDLTASEYRLFRIGEPLLHPETGELLGIEGIHLADARMERADEDTSKLIILDSVEEVLPGDRLMPITEEAPLPYFLPHAPEEDLSGWIMRAPRGVLEVGRYDVVILSAGAREGVEQGHVFRAMWHRGTHRDPVTQEEFDIPEEESGLMMVFRVFEKVSYALILQSSRAISVGDRFQSPLK